MFGPKLTDAQKAAKKAEKERIRQEQDAAAHERNVARRQAQKERFDRMPVFIVRETREVRVKADDMQDAIALASAAFKEGQDDDHTIKWNKPFGVEGDTIDKVRVINVKALEDE